MKEYQILCPICKSDRVKINTLEYEVPNLGKVLLFSFYCENCLFKVSDVFPLEEKEKVIYEIEIRSEKDLNKKIIISPFTKIKIVDPEIEITSGIGKKFEIILVETLFQRVLDILKLIDNEKKHEIEEKVKKILENKAKTKIIIEDEKGLSKVLDL